MSNNPTSGTIGVVQFFNRFPTEQDAREHVERLRWGSKPICVHCGSTNVTHVKNEKPQPYRCKDCRKHFSVKTGTIFQSAKLGLRECLYAMYLMTVSKKGISSCQLARELGCTQKTAWYLEQRIREAYEQTGQMLVGTIEADETYFGGKAKNMHADKRKKLTGRGTADKTAVVGVRSRESEQVVATPVKSTDASTVQSVIHTHVERGSTVYTDESRTYNRLNIGGEHESVNHSAGEYVRGKVHTNGIESFWSLLKRGYIGIFHHFSVKHLHRYVNEFAVRYNRRKWTTIAQLDQTMRGTFYKVLGYRRLICEK